MLLQGSNHKLLSADEEKHLAYKIQAILPYEEKFEELHRQNVAAAGIDLETQAESGRPNASHPDVEAGKFNPSFREWAVACDRADDMQAFEHEIWSGRQVGLAIELDATILIHLISLCLEWSMLKAPVSPFWQMLHLLHCKHNRILGRDFSEHFTHLVTL